MNQILGFGKSEEDKKVHETLYTGPSGNSIGVKSLVQVSFADIHRTYAYYNDKFDLKAGDLVFVSGCLEGKLGCVESVNYKFKINLADYERVVAHPIIEIHGHFRQIMDKMVSYDSTAVSPETFRDWVKAPTIEGEEPEEFVQGEGYSFELEHFAESDEVEGKIMERAVDYCRSGRVRYLSLRNGIGTAFVEGTKWYEVNFNYKDGIVSDMYCECPYAALCKHNLAVIITLNALLKKTDGENFTALDWNCFMRFLSISGQDIML